MRCLQMMFAQFRSECASNEILGTLQQTQPWLENVVGPLLFTNNIVMVVSVDDASNQIEDDVEEDDMADWNDELHDNCEDNYVGEHDDCLKDDKEDVEGVDPIYDNLIILENDIRLPDYNDQDKARLFQQTYELGESALQTFLRPPYDIRP
ncbi:Uncharacterized protein TCM_017317 [Theobroma cacao]|uniref:Uncharacterized protein n=1 Tax=Theobroma cacao TaxID=3641 RepID=A0A061ED49_THECC|nr:Uncharacterized protein TCM_017317 [Theobroma cacao]